jgi:hypothetical protein
MLASLLALTVAASPAPAARNYALRFSDDADGVKVPDAKSLHITGELTVEAWIKPEEGVRDRPFDFIISRNYSAHGYALLLIGRNDENRLQFEANNLVNYGVPEPWLRDKWWHVAGVVKGTTMTLYVNAVKVGESTSQALLRDINAPLLIGTSYWGNFRGCIDEVRIWNVARTPEQIAAWKDRYVKPTEAGLAAYWSFDEGKGQQVWDKVKRTKPGVLGSGPTKDAGDPKWVPGAPLR